MQELGVEACAYHSECSTEQKAKLLQDIRSDEPCTKLVRARVGARGEEQPGVGLVPVRSSRGRASIGARMCARTRACSQVYTTPESLRQPGLREALKVRGTCAQPCPGRSAACAAVPCTVPRALLAASAARPLITLCATCMRP